MSDRSPSVDPASAAEPAPRGSNGASSAPPPVDGSTTPQSQPVPPPAAPPALPVTAQTPRPVLLEGPALIDPGDDDESWGAAWDYAPSWLASMVVHLGLVLALALLTTLTVVRDTAPPLTVSAERPSAEEAPEELSADMTASAELESPQALQPVPLDDAPDLKLATSPILPILPQGEQEPVSGQAEVVPAAGDSGVLAMRLNGDLKQELLRSGGGTPESEEAVLAALAWLAEHQNYDGSWTFQHDHSAKCRGRCGNPGFTPGKNAATGLALLPFLGAGQTQFEGTHKRTIELGLKFLVRSIKHQGELGSLWDPHGQMYGHGLAAIALCEAYGMTRDPTLREPAQSVVNYIVEAQDQIGGGWRYEPKMPGDTSVVGWQLMALKSAEMAYLRVPQTAYRKAGYFLDSVQGLEGAVYGYQRPDLRRPSTTSIGLLCRMYLGWPRDYAPLEKGVQTLATIGPSTDKTQMRSNMYYNYYATQVMHHWGGYPWERWNKVMRTYLVRTQSRRGHELGSWYFGGSDHGDGAGGRLYYTALAAMTLEVYYRHMPLYRDNIVDK